MVNAPLLVQWVACASAAFEVLLENYSFGCFGLFPSARCSSCFLNFVQQPCQFPQFSWYFALLQTSVSEIEQLGVNLGAFFFCFNSF